MTRRRWPAAVPVLLSLALAATAPPAHGQDAPPARTEAELRTLLDGSWYLTIADSAGQSRIDAAIERAVGEMNFFLQGVTRTQLRENTPLNRRIDLDFPEDGRMTVVFDQRYTYTTRPSVAQDFDLPEGGSVNVTQLFRDGHLEQVFRAALGTRWNVYTLDAAGTTMTCTATTQGPMMPVPVVFALEYRQRS